MSLRKKFLLVLLVPVLLVVAAWVFLDHIAKEAIRIGGQQAMGVRTEVQSVRIWPLVGKGAIRGLEVSNPEGFETPYFMSLEECDAALDIGSIPKDTVVMKTIEIDGLKAHLEKSKEGANYEVILANLKKGEEEGASGEEPGKKFLVERVVVRNIDVRADLAIAGEKLSSVDLHIDEIQLENMGSDSGSGVVMSQLMGTIVKAVLTAIVEQGARILPEAMLNGLGAGLKGLGKVGIKVVGNVTVKVGGEAVKVLGGAGKAVGGAIKGILGGDDEDDDK